MTAARAGIMAYNQAALVALDENWDAYGARLSRYQMFEHYYANTVYSRLALSSASHKHLESLYKHIRAIYNPVKRQNDLLVSYVYGGSLDMEHLSGGAIPLVFDNKALQGALRNVYTWSRWSEQKSLFVRQGALYGDVGLKVVDDRAAQKVRLEVLHPSKIKAVDTNSVGDVKAVVIEYEITAPPSASVLLPDRMTWTPDKSYTYTEMIDAQRFQTLRDGKPFAYYADASGALVSEWSNEYGFVPLVLAKHADMGFEWGGNAFHSALRKIDEINDSASILNDQVRKSVNALWYFAGVRANTELVASTDDRDKVPAIYGPAESQPFAMVFPLDIPGASANIRDMLMELERDMPELALQRVREQGGSFTAPGIRAAYSDAIGRIQEARGNYDAAFVRALQMAVSVGGVGGYRGFESFSLASYASGEIDMHVLDRPVIADSLSSQDRLTALASVSGQPPPIQRLMLKELAYSAAEIEDVVTAAQEAAEVAQRNAVRGAVEALLGTPTNDEEQANDQAQIPSGVVAPTANAITTIVDGAAG